MLKCGRVIFEQSSQLPGLSKAFVKRKTFKKEAIFRGDQKDPLHPDINLKCIAISKINNINKNV